MKFLVQVIQEVKCTRPPVAAIKHDSGISVATECDATAILSLQFGSPF